MSTPYWMTISEEIEGVQNLHVLVRGKIELSPGPCLLRLSAKDYCHAWLDGVWLGQGPAPGNPNAYWYQEYPVQGGSQATLALHLYYQGLVNRVWNSGDNRYGLWAEVCCGEQERMLPEWRYQICDAYSGETVGYDTQFLENFDSRLWPEGWEQPGYDDSGWTAMVPADWDFPLLPQPTAYLERKQVEAISRQKISGGILLDFGRERVGTLSARAAGRAGDVLPLRCGEELDETGRVRFDMRCNCRYEEAWTLRDGATTCFEAWGKDQKWNTSLCHPWASGFIPLLIEELAGIHPDPDDSEGFRFAPHLPEELENFTLQAPLNGRLLQINQTGKKVKLICSTLK